MVFYALYGVKYSEKSASSALKVVQFIIKYVIIDAYRCSKGDNTLQNREAI